MTIHIKKTTEDNSGWCGELLGSDFYFKDAEAAAISGMYEPKQSCPNCVNKIIENIIKLNIDF